MVVRQLLAPRLKRLRGGDVPGSIPAEPVRVLVGRRDQHPVCVRHHAPRVALVALHPVDLGGLGGGGLDGCGWFLVGIG
jgi:hypothetical protein